MPKSVQEYLKMGYDLPMAQYFAKGRRTIVKIIPHKDYIKQPSIARLENGGAAPTIDTLLLLGQALGYTLKWERK